MNYEAGVARTCFVGPLPLGRTVKRAAGENVASGGRFPVARVCRPRFRLHPWERRVGQALPLRSMASEAPRQEAARQAVLRHGAGLTDFQALFRDS